MDIDLHALHFIRPLWLLLCLPATGLAGYWWRQQRSSNSLSTVIAPHLLKHLLIHPQSPAHLRPVYLPLQARRGNKSGRRLWKISRR
jgi:Ca-activated chloride channel family protein